MGYNELENNIYSVIKEQQIKLGYSPNSTWLYYPLDSLNNFLGEYDRAGNLVKPAGLDAGQMKACLADFAGGLRDKIGPVAVTVKGGMFCLSFDPKAAEYVHSNVPDDPFLAELIAVVSDRDHAHGVTMDDVLAVFRKYSDDVRIEESGDDEFDLLVWFGDGVPDDFRYCLADEMGHVTYHRFTAADLATRLKNAERQ